MMRRIVEGQMLFDLGGVSNIETVVMPVMLACERDLPKKEIKVVDNTKIIVSLIKSAESLLKQAEACHTEISGNFTNKRQTQADNAQKKQDRLLAWRKIILRLITEWENQTIPDILKKIKTAKDIEFIVWNGGYPKKPDGDSGEWYIKEYPIKLKKAISIGLTSKEINDQVVVLLGEYMLEEKTPEQIAKEKMKELTKEIHKMNIPGFFPTPKSLIDEMLVFADLENSENFLEPEAGMGDIADAVREKGFTGSITCVERQYTLANFLELKGYNVIDEDILETTELKHEAFDLILMNPPFEKGQDVLHVRYIYQNYLKSGGRLISIMSGGVSSNTTKRFKEFREWVEDRDGWFIDNGQAFKDAFNATGVNSVMLIIDKKL
jgi:hypothetical protein